MARATGETYRKLLFALREASFGNRVLYICPTIEHARHAFEYGHKLSSIVHAQFHNRDKKIIMPNNGLVQFRSAKMLISTPGILEGREFEHVIFDDLTMDIAARFFIRRIPGRGAGGNPTCRISII